MDEKKEQALRERERKREILKADIITGGIAFLGGSVIFLLYFLLGGKTLLMAINGVSLAGIVLIAAGMLAFLGRLGAFDTFAFAFMQLGHAMFGRNPKKYNSLSDYKDSLLEKRQYRGNYFFWIIGAGALYLLALIPLEIIFHSIY